jgi:ankyrin repeat protein
VVLNFTDISRLCFISKVEDPSYPNNEGLTALHHAVCNSHDDIVKFLIGYGCDINAADMQGW